MKEEDSFARVSALGPDAIDIDAISTGISAVERSSERQEMAS